MCAIYLRICILVRWDPKADPNSDGNRWVCEMSSFQTNVHHPPFWICVGLCMWKTHTHADTRRHNSTRSARRLLKKYPMFACIWIYVCVCCACLRVREVCCYVLVCVCVFSEPGGPTFPLWRRWDMVVGWVLCGAHQSTAPAIWGANTRENRRHTRAKVFVELQKPLIPDLTVW